jgi:hypothetical protein
MKHRFRFTGIAIATALCVPVAATASSGSTGGGGKLFIKSAVEHAGNTVTLPLHRGTSNGQTVWYIVLDSSDGNDASANGVNTSQKLENARGTTAVQKVRVINGMVDFPASVDFAPSRVIQAPNGFPPTVFQPGAVGQSIIDAQGVRHDYSPLIELPDGTVENAPQIARDANGDGRIDLLTEAADKVVSIDTVNRTVTYRETNGFARKNPVKYVSTDSSDPLAATLEDVTLAPALNGAPFPDGDGTDSARASLGAFVNGQTGATNPQRQGLNSAVVDGLDPLNVLAWNPSQGRYSPLWDVHLAQWTAQAIASGQNVRQTEFAGVADLAQKGLITGPGGAPFGASGFIVDCPIVSQG